MKKFEWWNLGSFDAEKLNHLKKALSSSVYTEEAGKGFLIGRVSKVLISGRFVEKEVAEFTVKGPNGELFEQRQIKYHSLEFEIGTKFPHLTIFDSPRRTKPFVNSLAWAFDGRIVVERVNLDLRKVVKALSGAKMFELSRIQVIDLKEMNQTFFTGSIRGPNLIKFFDAKKGRDSRLSVVEGILTKGEGGKLKIGEKGVLGFGCEVSRVAEPMIRNVLFK